METNKQLADDKLYATLATATVRYIEEEKESLDALGSLQELQAFEAAIEELRQQLAVPCCKTCGGSGRVRTKGRRTSLPCLEVHNSETSDSEQEERPALTTSEAFFVIHMVTPSVTREPRRSE